MSSTGWTDAPTKLPKLLNFVDRKDNLDRWLTRCEIFAEMSQLPLQKWASLLSANLTERALGCYGRLPQAQALNYEKPLSEESGGRSDSDSTTRGRREDCAARAGSALEMTANLHNEIKDWNASAGERKSSTGCKELPRAGRSKDDEGSPCAYPAKGYRR
ncbi:hypothetical protein PoB_004820500 [Plakobranchus ocellatus]|uniref:Uncharacterized protein n=1 Tax=Plakobranchus ocellatus TaxID=259542 RepID=A0AAV4BMF0_9GAST|nr:hypothetical protein PoB_004820500 [Plakobranchus ocellatus]